MEYKEVINHANESMGKALDHLKKEFSTVRTGRASTAIVENVQVEAYGMKQALRNLASIGIQDSTTITIKPFDASTLGAISKAITDANLGLNPVDDGKMVRVSLPPMTEENRKKIAGQLKDMAEGCKVSLRNARQEANKLADAALKDKTLNEDNHRDLKEEIQGKINGKNKDVESLLKEKTEEVMAI